MAKPFFQIKGLDVLNLEASLKEIAREIQAEFGLNLITSAYRPGDTGVHGQMPVRGLDLRCLNPKFGLEAEAWVNLRWRYDPARPKKQVALFHNVGRGLHLHIQVHPGTKKTA